MTRENDRDALIDLARRSSRTKGTFDEEGFGAVAPELISGWDREGQRLEEAVSLLLEASDSFQNEIGCFMLSSFLLNREQKARIISQLIERNSINSSSLWCVVLEGLRDHQIMAAEFFEQTLLKLLDTGDLYAATGPLVACLQRDVPSVNSLLQRLVVADMHTPLPVSSFSATACLISDVSRFIGLSKLSFLLRLSAQWPNDLADYFLRQTVAGIERIDGTLSKSDKLIAHGLVEEIKNELASTA